MTIRQQCRSLLRHSRHRPVPLCHATRILRHTKRFTGSFVPFNNDPVTYKEVFNKTKQQVSDCARFAPPLSRPLTSEYSKDEFAKLMTGKYKTTWKGSVLMKSPLDLVIYSQLMQELKPRVIFDIGTANGGSALWFADQAVAMGLTDFKVITIDIEDMRAEECLNNPNIEFWKGDLHELDQVLSPEALEKLPHPWMVVEDAHVNVYKLLMHLHLHGLQVGDYVVVDDVHPEAPNESGMGHRDMDKYETGFGPGKFSEVQKFLAALSKEYALDLALCDMFGLNSTQAANSILKRVQPKEEVHVREYASFRDISWADVRSDLSNHGHVVLRPKEGTSTEQLLPTADTVMKKLELLPGSYDEGTEVRIVNNDGDMAIPLINTKLIMVMPHHELCYTSSKPDVVCFRCENPPESIGGETTLFDARKAFELLSPKLRERLQKETVLYSRRLVDGAQVSDVSEVHTWQYVLGGNSLADAMAAAKSKGYEIIDSSDNHIVYSFSTHLALSDCLNMSDVAPMIFEEYYFGEWENIYTLKWKSTGECVERDVILDICAAYGQARRHFSWSRCGETVILDNHWMAHGRGPYAGTQRCITSRMGYWKPA